MLIGNKGAGMFNHIDVLRSASWQAQVHGAKRWHICAPDQSRYLSAGTLDCFHPDYEKYPLFDQANVNVFEMLLERENAKSPAVL